MPFQRNLLWAKLAPCFPFFIINFIFLNCVDIFKIINLFEGCLREKKNTHFLHTTFKKKIYYTLLGEEQFKSFSNI